MQAIRDELSERRVEFDTRTLWTHLLTKLKEDEGDDKQFKPCLPIERFVIAETRPRNQNDPPSNEPRAVPPTTTQTVTQVPLPANRS